MTRAARYLLACIVGVALYLLIAAPLTLLEMALTGGGK